MTAREIIETYGRRWNLETTFREMRSYLKLESTRGWCQKTVRRAEPCLLGMYTVVACMYDLAPRAYRRKGGVGWPGKEHLTFSDAMTGVRQWL